VYAAEHATKRPDQAALILANSGSLVTFSEYEAAANRWAHVFRHAELRHGDHVAFLMENSPILLECEAGADRTGLYFTCVNFHLSPNEVAYIVDDSNARLFITSTAQFPTSVDMPLRCPSVERWIVADATGPVPAPWEKAEDVLAGVPATPVDNEQIGMAMFYSSGTTGRPKGILRPLPNTSPDTMPALIQGLRSLWQLRDDMVYLSPAPLYHTAPQTNVSVCLRLGATVVLMEKFDAAEFLALVARYRVTHSQMVPTMFTRLLKLPEAVKKAADVSSMEVIIHSAAPCPVPIKEQMIDWFGPILIEYYGATEAYGLTQISAPEWLEHRGSVGKCMMGELLILDDELVSCPIATPGTVWFRGATDFEYFNDSTKTSESRVTTDLGTMSTVGDVGYVDRDGYLYLTDRKAYMIISGGVNIYPQETENLLIAHPKVMDAAVFGVPDEELGEVVKAVVQPVSDVEAPNDLERELIDFCHQHLARFKCPRSIDFEEELPRLPTGKLYKRLLRDRYWQNHETRIL
jgi:long-chain acyl-CoA synthetase